MNNPQLYAIYEDLIEVTDAGVGIPRRRPRLTAQQCALVRHQLEHGACLSSFDAGINGDADPGLRPFSHWIDGAAWEAHALARKAVPPTVMGRLRR